MQGWRDARTKRWFVREAGALGGAHGRKEMAMARKGVFGDAAKLAFACHKLQTNEREGRGGGPGRAGRDTQEARPVISSGSPDRAARPGISLPSPAHIWAGTRVVKL